MPKVRRTLSALLLSLAVFTVLGSGMLAALLTPQPVYAQEGSSNPVIGSIISSLETASGACAGLYPCPPKGAADALRTLDNKVFTPMIQIALTSGLLNLATFALDRIAYESAVFLASGGKGQTPLFNTSTAEDAWQDFGKDLVGESLGQLSDFLDEELNIKFNLCAPASPEFRLGLQLGLVQAYQPREPKCEFDTVAKNWSGFISTIATGQDPSGKALSEFALGLSPGRNELSASIGIAFGVQQQVIEAKSIGLAELLGKQGYKDVTDLVTGQVETPASILQRNTERQLVENKDKAQDYQIQNAIENSNIIWGLFAHVASTFTNTFLSTAISEIAKGLVPATPGGNPFDIEGLAGGGREAAAERFNSLVTAQPISVANYNAIAEFVTCPAGGAAQRNVNNCVLDANFASGIARAEAGVPLTVQEAVDEGLLDGDWVLVPPTQATKNQDPFCYTYAFCYSNLVKLRKARILPVGWEMAAKINTGADPKTLQQILDSFDDCEAGDPFCHLVDPNWVLKYPETQCKALVNGQLLISASSGGRAGYCADTPSCVATDSDGNCTGGFGYCVAEKNVWRFRGEECPAQFASCLAFANTNTNERAAFLVSTVDFSVCTQDNAGCRWYRSNKFFDTKGTADPADDGFSFLPVGTTYAVAPHDAAIQTATSTRAAATQNLYAYEDRNYFNNDVKECDESSVGCGEVRRAAGVTLNAVRNPSFETNAAGGGFLSGWVATGGTPTASTDPSEGSVSASLGAATITQRDIELAPQSFYSFTVEAKGSAPTAEIVLRTKAGTAANLSGTNVRGCTLFGTNMLRVTTASSLAEFARFTCTFTTGAAGLLADVRVSGNTLVDAIQLERGEVATTFTEGYSDVNAPTVALKVPPAYLNCQGLPTDPAECESYAGVCTAAEVGCELYVPQDGDPSVPAVASELDRCPAACVGYAAFKQEATRYETAKFPLFFIPDQARSCEAQNVGCDAFTNLDAVAAGGEGIESYTSLRACVLPDPSGSTQGNYFTWEGTDASGFQLRSFQLLSSNSSGIDAPCSNFRMTSQSTLVCEDPGTFTAPASCNDHGDIFTNPDCREFYNEAGTISYRLFSDTVTVSADCHPYRKGANTASAAQAQLDCQTAGGFFETSGDCRYLGLPSESVSCPVTAAGCRAYTGGAGRNAVTVLNEAFESGTFATWRAVGGSSLSISNESVSAGGHSLRLANMANGRGTESVPGTFTGKLVPGKTFMLEFWARGTGNIDIFLVENGGSGPARDFVTDGTADTNIALSAGWRPYSVGPLDTSAFAGVNDTALLRFVAEGAVSDVYLDNITLKQAEDNITLIKDSWTVPAACDQTPTGAASPQFFLGCEAYKDRAGDDFSFYQFSSLCSEDKVGCEAFYDSRDSASPYGQTYNARCVVDGADAGSTPDIVSTPTNCSYLGAQVCTIQPGKDFCLFDFQGAIRTITATDGIQLGPEARVIGNDVPMFLVNNGAGQCSAASVGCEEVGLPTFNADKTEVTGFESKFLLVDPLPYGDDVFSNILCDQEALFCEEWSSTQDGNFYFKDPLGQTCEYKQNIAIGGRKFFGWFRAGTSEPCSYVDVNNDGNFDLDVDSPRVRGGEEFLLPLNGDDVYDGFVGACETRFDLCTEFRDPTDTDKGREPQGQPYYFKNDDQLDESSLQATQRCEGEVSQKAGCALFRSSTDTRLLYSATATYTASNHADLLFGEEAFSKVDPIDCSAGSTAITPPAGGTSVDLCQQRCGYDLPAGESLLVVGADQTGNTAFAGSCVADNDCAPQRASDDIVYQGTCRVGAAVPRLSNDTNVVTKVNRDRECAEWLTCSSTGPEWDPREGRWRDLCQAVSLCSEFAVTGESTFCAGNAVRDAVPLTKAQYVARDVTWTGQELSGYSIPDAMPAEYLSQVNVAPTNWCVDAQGEPIGYGTATTGANASRGFGFSCVTPEDCVDLTGDANSTCEPAPADIRLAFVAGSCELPSLAAVNGQSCTVGFCRDDGTACSDDGECQAGDDCIFGFCEVTSTQACTTDTDCSGGTPVCNTDIGRCVNVLESQLGTASFTSCSGTGSCTAGGQTGTCKLPEKVRAGSCVSGSCITDITGAPLGGSDATVDFSCRGYPEANSPVPVSTVDLWTPTTSTNRFVMPIAESRIPGFETMPTCTPYFDNGGTSDTGDDKWVTTGECDCNYRHFTYGDGAVNAYFSSDLNLNIQQFKSPKICAGGQTPGKTCNNAVDCGPAVGAETVTCDTQTATGRGIPKKVCAGGPRSAQPCFMDADCGNAGLCASITKQETVIGFEGYCLERDTGIQTLGSQNTEDQVCLTWFPVEQLTGATNLFAKFETAGFSEDAFYCAETDMFYHLTTSEQACAEDTGNGGSPARSDHNKFTATNNCFWSAYCPTGYFAVMTPAEGSRNDANDDSGGFDNDNNEVDLDPSNQVSACKVNDGFRDCPYFCVPNNSVIVEDNGNVTECDVPTEVFNSSAVKMRHIEADGSSDDSTLLDNDDFGTGNGPFFQLSGIHIDFDAYLLKRQQYLDAIEHYADCQQVVDEDGMVDALQQRDFVSGHSTTSFIPFANPGFDSADNFYENLHVEAEPFLGCRTIVQTSEADEDQKNAAWTDRTWFESGRDRYTLKPPSNGAFNPGYTTQTPIVPFGQAIPPEDADGKPHEIASCVDDTGGDFVQAKIAGRCDSDETSSLERNFTSTDPLRGSSCTSATVTPDNGAEGFEARSYDGGHIIPEGAEFNPVPAVCDAGVCENAATGAALTPIVACSNDSDCSVGVQCQTAADCNAGISCSSGTCDGGPLDGRSCSTEADCDALNCGTLSDVDCDGPGLVSPTPNTCRLNQPVFVADPPAAAKDRLGQIFARIQNSSDLILTWDFGTSIYDSASSAIRSQYTYDLRGTGDPSTITGREAPTPPVVRALGDCDGATCKEGQNSSVSLNDIDGGIINGIQRKRVTMKFYMFANDDQLPIRTVLADWGAGNNYTLAGDRWLQSLVGSDDTDNFYKNQRGLDAQGNPICGSGGSDRPRGLSEESCDSSFRSFANEYTCSAALVNILAGDRAPTNPARICEVDGDGHLVNSPCTGGDVPEATGKCVFQPRVYVEDNWGWCAGECGADGRCFGPNECNTNFPAPNAPTTNPWIYFDGFVVVEP